MKREGIIIQRLCTFIHHFYLYLFGEKLQNRTNADNIPVNKNLRQSGNCFQGRERDIGLEINVRDINKIVEVWLTREERQDVNIRKRLKFLYQEYRAKKFLVAVFESGEQSLEELTGSLLSYNRKRAVQMEMEREKRQGAWS